MHLWQRHHGRWHGLRSRPADFTVDGATADPTCTATENPIPTGYSSTGTCQALLSAGSCTITNTLIQEPGSITIRKDVPGTDSQNFSFSDNIPGCSIGTLDDDPGSGTPQSVTCSSVTLGTSTVSENVPSDWFLEDINCSGSGDWNTDVNNEEVTITVAFAESVTCTFENEEPFEPPPPPTSTPVPPTATPVEQVAAIQATATPVVVVVLPSSGTGGLERASGNSMLMIAGLLTALTGMGLALWSRKAGQLS